MKTKNIRFDAMIADCASVAQIFQVDEKKMWLTSDLLRCIGVNIVQHWLVSLLFFSSQNIS